MTDQLPRHPILPLVEDGRVLEPVLEAALSDDGFEVLTAATGAKAISELEANGIRFKGSVTDIRLGSGLSGWEVRHRARQHFPGIPVIYMSGGSAHEWSAEGVPGSIMLRRPCAISQLIAAITTLLNAAMNVAALSGSTPNGESSNSSGG